MKLCSKNTKHRKFQLIFLIPFLALIIHTADSHASEMADINSWLSFQALIPLTPGSSTVVKVKGKGAIDVTTILCLGGGTLTIGLIKDDTEKDLVSLFIVGSKANPSFIPNIVVTPATINAITIIDEFAIIFAFSRVYSNKAPPYEYTLLLKLTPKTD